jgi:thiamine pyrophosphokinase
LIGWRLGNRGGEVNMRVVIFANGDLHNPAQALASIRPDDFLVAADGGARHCRALGLTPAIAIGDFDSLPSDELVQLEADGVRVIRYPARKDFTDLELALQHAVALGAEEILVFGALGARWDHTLANLLISAAPGFERTCIRLLDDPQEILLLRAGETHILLGRPGDIVSLIPLGGNATGITTVGLEYPLTDGVLYFGTSRGVSNVLLGEQATVHLKTGLLLCVVIHEATRINID